MDDLLEQLSLRLGKASKSQFAEGQAIIEQYIRDQGYEFKKPVIAIAGTNGKGSCVAMLIEIYLRAGYQVGAYVSPHLNTLDERFLLNGKPIDEHSLKEVLKQLLNDPSLESLSYFEILTLCAWILWMKIDPDVIIMEVGLGGRFDAVNALPINAGIITSIGLDHIEWLGDSLELIAIEKAGIAKASMPLVVAEPNMPTKAIAAIDQAGAILYQNGFAYEAHVVDQDFIWSYDGTVLNLPRPRLHPQSVGAALMMVKTLDAQIPVDESCFEYALMNADLPGRFECINDQKQIWVDVAHNVPAVKHLMTRWPFAWEETCCIIAIKNTKDWQGMLKVLMQNTKHVYVVDFTNENMVSPKKIVKYLKVDDTAILPVEDLASFLSMISEKTLVFGSFALVNQVRQIGLNELTWNDEGHEGNDDA